MSVFLCVVLQTQKTRGESSHHRTLPVQCHKTEFFFALLLFSSHFSLSFPREWLGGADSEKARAMLHTEYHEVEKFVSALTIKW